MTDNLWEGMKVNAMPPTDPATRARAAAAAQRAGSVVPIRPRSDSPVEHRSHLRMAERFTEEHGQALRFVHRMGWFWWDGARWREDEKRTDMAAAIETVKNAIRDLAGMPSGQERDDLYKDIRKSESSSAIEGITKLAASQSPISTAATELDTHAHLFNTPGGTIDLEARQELEAQREHLITKCSRGKFCTERSEVFEQFIERILPDPAVRQFVQRLFGYAMLGAVREHFLPIFTGTGANGKGTLRDAVMWAFGDYADEVDPAILMESGERHGAFKMKLRGKRLVFCSETDREKRLAEATMKRLTGGDPIEANYMHQNPITFMPTHTLVMMTNFLPKVSGDDPAVWRRILIVPFDVVIPEEERDGTLPAQLQDAADAVMTWVLHGWVDYQEQGLNPPPVVRAATARYREDSDLLARFLEERTQKCAGSCSARELFTAWSSWCRSSGEQAGTEKAFAETMTRAGFTKKRTSAGQQYLGLMLLADDDQDDDDHSGWGGARRVVPPAEPVQDQIPADR